VRVEAPSSLLAVAAKLLSESALSVLQIRRAIVSLLLLRLADSRDAEQEAMAAFEEMPWKPILPTRLRWRNIAKLEIPQQVADHLLDLAHAVARLRDAAADPMANHLHALSEPLHEFLKVRPHIVREVVNLVDALPLDTPSDRRAALTSFDRDVLEMSWIGDGVFASPPSIARLVAVLARPRPDERVYDPCFGLGNLLLALWQYAEGSGKQPRRSGSLLQVAGVEITADAFLMGLTRMLLGGVDAPRLAKGDALERSSVNPARIGFDLVVADPPWGLKVGTRYSRDPSRYQHFQIATSDATGLFIQHAMSQLNPSGRAIVVVPEGFLSRGGADRELRRKLVEAGQVEAVVGLPPGIHERQTQLKSCLLLLNKKGGASRVRMADASSFFEKPSGRSAPSIRTDLAVEFAKRLLRQDISTGDASSLEAIDARADEQPAREQWEIATEEIALSEWDLTPRRRESGGLEDMLANIEAALQPDSRVVPLSDVAKVILGRSVNTKDLVEVQPQYEPIPYLRIRDVVQGRVVRPSTWLSSDAVNTERQYALQVGDVLLSKSGTIGKAAIVTNGAVGSVAGSGFYVLRANRAQVDSAFLLAYLNSAACQNWMAARGRGAVIQHLNRAVLEKLPIVLPPLSLQERAAAQHRDFGTDVLVFLGQIAGTGESDRFSAWLAELGSKVPTLTGSPDAVPSLSLMDPLVEMAQTGLLWIERDELASQTAQWMKPLVETVLSLQGVSQIPIGPSLLTVLQEAERGFQFVSDRAGGHLPLVSQARAIADLLSKWMRAASVSLIQKNRVGIRATVDKLSAGTFAEFAIELANEGALPLRSLRVETQPDWGSASYSFFPERTSVAMNLSGDVPKNASKLTLQVGWSARDLNSREIRGAMELAIPIVEMETTSARTVELGASPYVTGSPLEPRHGNDVFFGRDQLLAQITRQISAHGNVVLLEGNRRAGKTSILKHLEGRDRVPNWLAVYSSLQGAEGAATAAGVPTAEVFREIARSIATALTKLAIEVPLPNRTKIEVGRAALGVARACREGISEAAPFADFREYLEVVLALLEPMGLGVVLMLDEFDKLQEGIDNGVTSPQVPENIRFLIQSYPRFSAILTGSRRLKRLREEYWSALYGLGTSMTVAMLDESSAKRVVTEPVHGQLTYSHEAVERAVQITARHPYLLQCLCNRIFEYAAQARARSITLATVNDMAMALVKDNEHFASLWDYAGHGSKTGRHRRQLELLILAQAYKPEADITFPVLREQLAQMGVEVGDEPIATDLEYLRELDLIELTGHLGDGHYQLAIPMMAEWIEQQHDMQVVASRARTEAEEE
jgi:type I restriction enzyme M protein